MENQKTFVKLSGWFLALAMIPGAVWAQGSPQKCDGRDIATGPFIYATEVDQVTTFTGLAGDNGVGDFSVTAPSPNQDSPETPNVFAGEGQDRCLDSALAEIHVHGIVKVAEIALDGTVTALDPAITLNETDPIYQKILDSFVMNPDEHTFSWLDEDSLSVDVDVDVSNPNAIEGEFGIYQVTMKAHAPGAGIGTGPGIMHTLELYPPAEEDIVPPNVSITKPAAQDILGTIAVEIKATDPLPGTGVETMSATVSSQGGSVSNQLITLSYLPAAAGFEAVATGNFTPWGGAAGSLLGTTLANAFDNDPNTPFNTLSGIGNYRIDAQATDYAGNTGLAVSFFQVLYDMQYATPVLNGCSSANLNGCHATFSFTANRSSVTSDGAFMFDKTVVVKLVQINDPNTDADDVLMETRAYGPNQNTNVKIDEVALKYITKFSHQNLDENPNLSGQQKPTTLKNYRLEIYFVNEGGSLMLQNISPSPEATF